MAQRVLLVYKQPDLGGIGEHATSVRERIVKRLAAIGVGLSRARRER